MSEGAPEADEVRKTTSWVFDQIMLILNPVMPFITEELYAAMGERAEGTRLMTSQWPAYGNELVDTAALSEMDWLTRTITEIRSVRADMNVPAGAKIRLLVKDASEQTQERLKTYDEILCRMARLESVETTADVAAGAIQTVVDEATLILPIADIIDLDQERARLQKEIGKLTDDIKKIEQKLSNEKFIANAPEEVVEEQRSRKAEAESIINKLETALKQLAAA